MKGIICIVIFISFLLASIAFPDSSPLDPGADLFKKHCAGCHKTRDKIKQVPDFVRIMRSPTSPMMPAFTADRLSDANARAISEYIRMTANSKPVR